jgi:hypothetical protein
MRRLRLDVIAVGLVTLLVGATAASAGTPTDVKATANDELFGSGNADYFAWTFVSRRDPHVYRVKVQPTGGDPFSLNTRGRRFSGDMDPNGTVLPYSRILGRGDSRTDDIFLYDMEARTDVAVPDGINTGKNEFFPAISGNHMTFLRRSATSETLWLVTDLSTGDKIPIVTLDPRETVVANPPNIVGNWLAYAICRHAGCEAYRYDISQGQAVKVPNPRDKYSYAPAVDLAGTVYVERSSLQCGQHATLVKWTGSGDPTVFHEYRSGHDLTSTSVYDDGGGNVTLYVDVYDCAHVNEDIVSFSNP